MTVIGEELRASYAFMERNFKKEKRRPYCPMRCWRNRTGPREVSLTINAIRAKTGAPRIRATRLPAMSIDLLTIREGRAGVLSWKSSS